MDCPKYIEWIAREAGIKLENGKEVSSFLLDYKTNEAYFDEWALHIRLTFGSACRSWDQSRWNTGPPNARQIFCGCFRHRLRFFETTVPLFLQNGTGINPFV